MTSNGGTPKKEKKAGKECDDSTSKRNINRYLMTNIMEFALWITCMVCLQVLLAIFISNDMRDNVSDKCVLRQSLQFNIREFCASALSAILPMPSRSVWRRPKTQRVGYGERRRGGSAFSRCENRTSSHVAREIRNCDVRSSIA